MSRRASKLELLFRGVAITDQDMPGHIKSSNMLWRAGTQRLDPSTPRQDDVSALDFAWDFSLGHLFP
jgi:hypothetical protein